MPACVCVRCGKCYDGTIDEDFPNICYECYRHMGLLHKDYTLIKSSTGFEIKKLRK
jgi:hypothetical protein